MTSWENKVKIFGLKGPFNRPIRNMVAANEHK